MILLSYSVFTLVLSDVVNDMAICHPERSEGSQLAPGFIILTPGFLLDRSLYLMKRGARARCRRSKYICQIRLVLLAWVLWESPWPTTYSKQVLRLSCIIVTRR